MLDDLSGAFSDIKGSKFELHVGLTAESATLEKITLEQTNTNFVGLKEMGEMNKIYGDEMVKIKRAFELSVHTEGCERPFECPNRHLKCKEQLDKTTLGAWGVAQVIRRGLTDSSETIITRLYTIGMMVDFTITGEFSVAKDSSCALIEAISGLIKLIESKDCVETCSHKAIQVLKQVDKYTKLRRELKENHR